MHFLKTSGLSNLVYQKNVTIKTELFPLCTLLVFRKISHLSRFEQHLVGSRELGGKHFRRGRAEPGANTGGKPSLSPAHFSLACCPVPLCWHQLEYNSNTSPPLWATTLQVAAGGTILCSSAAHYSGSQVPAPHPQPPDCPVLGSGGTKK